MDTINSLSDLIASFESSSADHESEMASWQIENAVLARDIAGLKKGALLYRVGFLVSPFGKHSALLLLYPSKDDYAKGSPLTVDLALAFVGVRKPNQE